MIVSVVVASGEVVTTFVVTSSVVVEWPGVVGFAVLVEWVTISVVTSGTKMQNKNEKTLG